MTSNSDSEIREPRKLTLPRTLSLRHARRHRARTALMVACIALGVAAWTTIDALDRGLDAALRAAVTPLAGAADLYVSNGDAGLRADLAEQVVRVPEVRAVRPILVRRSSARARSSAHAHAGGRPGGAEARRRRLGPRG